MQAWYRDFNKKQLGVSKEQPLAQLFSFRMPLPDSRFSLFFA
jgi:hypothetical protein